VIQSVERVARRGVQTQVIRPWSSQGGAIKAGQTHVSTAVRAMQTFTKLTKLPYAADAHSESFHMDRQFCAPFAIRSWAPSATPRRTTSRRPGHLTTKSDVWRFGVGAVRDPRSAALHRAQPAQERAEAPGPGAAALRRKQAVRRDH
jgi:hypothetical protein